MPNLDMTGPIGAGPMTGMGMGVGNVDAQVNEPVPVPQEQETAEEVRVEDTRENETVQYKLTDEQKKEVVAHVKKLIDDCEAARSGWKDIRIECLKLNDGVREPKSDPWDNCSNISVMAAPTHARLMHSKLMPSVWNENLIYWQPVSNDDIMNVENVRKFMNWIIRRELKLADLVDDIVNDLIINGTVALKVRFDTEYRYVRDKDNPGKYKEISHKKAVIDNVPIDDVFLPYLWKGVDESEFIAQNIWLRLPEIKALRNDGKLNITEADLDKLEGKIDELSGKGEGIDKTKADIEGTQESYSFKVSYPIRLIECYLKWYIDGKMVESVFMIDYNNDIYMSGKPLTAVSPIGRRPWVIGQFIRRTNRPYGISLIEAIRGLAHELDAIHNQRIDAGSISIAPWGVYRSASSFRPQKVQISPGAMIPVDDINDVKIVQFQGNFVNSFQEERIIIEYIEKLTTTSAYQMGRESDIVKSRATATGTMAIIQQGEQAYTLLGLRCQRIISKMLTKILQAYQCFMPSGLADRIVGDDAGKLLFPDGLTPEEIDGGYDCYMALDSTAGNLAMERQTNQVMLQMAPTFLALAQDPRGYEIAREFIISLGKLDVEKYIGKKPMGAPKTMAGGPVGPGLNMAQPMAGVSNV